MQPPALTTAQLQARLAELQAAQPHLPTPYEAALLGAITLLTQQLSLLHDQIERQQQLIDDLATRMRQPTLPPRAARNLAPPASPPKVARSLEYWMAHVPEYGDPLTAEELATFQTKPRVRPEDIPITPAQPKRRRVYAPATPDAPIHNRLLACYLLLLCILALVFFYFARL